MMPTLPFVAAKTNALKSAIEPETSKQPDIKGANFNQMLSKQMAQDEVKKASAKVNEKLAQERAKQNNANKSGAEAKVAIQVAPSGALANKNSIAKNSADENRVGPSDIDQIGLDKSDLNKVDSDQNDVNQNAVNPNAVNENNFDPQLLALELTAKTVQEATDGKVVLVDTQQTEADKVISALQLSIGPPITAAIAPAIQTSNAIVTKPELSTIALTDKKVLGDVVEKSLARTRGSDDVPQQKTSVTADHQQLENDQFVQTMIAESKIKSGQEATMNKAMATVETSAIATVSAQQLATKSTTTAIQTGRDNNINVYPGKAGWNEAVSQKVIWMVGATEQTAKLTLNPPELGPLEVIINVSNDKADATFVSENPEVRKALEDGLSSLRQLMGQAGVELGQANVSTSKQQQEFQQSNQQQLARQQTASSTSQFEESSSNPVIIRESNGLVDIFA